MRHQANRVKTQDSRFA